MSSGIFSKIDIHDTDMDLIRNLSYHQLMLIYSGVRLLAIALLARFAY